MMEDEITLEVLKDLQDLQHNIHDSLKTFHNMNHLCHKYLHSKSTMVNIFFTFLKEYCPNKLISKPDLVELYQIYSFSMKIDYKDKKYIYSILVEAWILHIQWLNATNMKKKLEKQEEKNEEEGKKDEEEGKKDEEEEKKDIPISKPVVQFNPSITYFFY
jgi:hypothetical protein